MPARLRCCVPHCRRTTDREEFKTWLCGKHWKLIPQVNRIAYGRYVRKWRRYGPETFTTDQLSAAKRLWRWLVRRATERSAGIV